MDFFAIICRYIGWRSYCHSTSADLSSRYSPSAQALRSHVSRWIRCICFHGLWFYGTGNSFHSCLADSAGIGRYSALGRTRHLGRSFRILSSTISPFSLIMISVSSPAGMLDCDIGMTMTENRNALTAETQDNPKAVRATVPPTYITHIHLSNSKKFCLVLKCFKRC